MWSYSSNCSLSPSLFQSILMLFISYATYPATVLIAFLHLIHKPTKYMDIIVLVL